MNVKKITSLTLLALATLSLAGCSLSGTVSSLQPYAPSDGVQVDAQSLKARNVLIIQGDSGRAVLIGSFVNSSQEDLVGSVQTKDSAGQDIRVEFAVKAGTKFDLGYNGNSALVIDLAGTPGKIANIFVIEGNGPGKEIRVPILDGTLAEYKEIFATLPGAATSTEPSAEPTEPAAEESNH